MFVLRKAAELGPQMAAKSCVVVEPPKGRPAEDDEPRPRPTQPLQFADRRGVVGRRPPIQSVGFKERKGARACDVFTSSQPFFINMDKCAPCWDKALYVFDRQPYPLCPWIDARSPPKCPAFFCCVIAHIPF